MRETTIRAEAEKIIRHRDRNAPDNVLVGDVVDLCLRVREHDAKIAERFTVGAKPKLITLMAQHNTATDIAAAIRSQGEES